MTATPNREAESLPGPTIELGPAVTALVTGTQSLTIGLDSALLVVDMQNGFLEPGGSFSRMGFDVEMLRPAIEGCVDLVEIARSVGVPVIFTRFVYQPGYADAGVTSRELFPGIRVSDGLAHGSWDADIIDGLTPIDGDFVVDKSRYSAFYGTRLQPLLTGLRVRTLVVCGITTNMCVESTVRDASQQDYRTAVVADATAEFTTDRRDHALTAIGYGFGWVTVRRHVAETWSRAAARERQ